MQSRSPAYMTALSNAPERGLIPRRLVYLTARDRQTGAQIKRGFWNDHHTLDIPVINGFTGLPETRTYIGEGALLGVSDITYVSDLTIQSVEIQLSQIVEAAQQMVRQYELRLGAVEIHECLLDPETRMPVSVELPDFLGMVDGAPIETPVVGGEGAIRVKAASDAIVMLTRINPRKASHEAHKAARGDDWAKYRAAMENVVTIAWGQ
ncbi:hypothetical protein [Ensifer canadensis]